ncbi:hypothetical protein COY90_02415 [Candidatus Roizmanbacteria bacterium CG_4_10_14_0_8_um_filter_39_9]|uniref:Polymerase beta nucleotidyltransferase domain-containing protein n=1 Tax=Candidatus Roizmanbacteria bacterium CG_4_10_14_0_8_um_filter_39_9 TaxID=1974829 RepID=A0A2M7QDV4_9BACT|nr:MAG: hypothetical protein COY90_02415 [Candidatus Roizmanbacteria bacterium CG_4_10_14_0_8_um_filter_39_9]
MSISSIKQQVAPIFEKYGIGRASLFGSVVRGEEKKTSDIDFLVEMPKNIHGFAYIGVRMDLQEDLERTLHKKVDLVEYHLVKPALRKYIFPEQVLIYQKNTA